MNVTAQAEKENALALGQVDSDYQNEILSKIKEGRIHRSKWRVTAREDYDFYAGKQWTDEEVSQLEDEGRPPVVFNRIVRTLNSVAGLEIQNRQETRYYPRNVGQVNQDGTSDSGYAEYMNSANKWARDLCNAEDEESEAFIDSLICGEGWTELRMDYETDPQGLIVKDRIDPLEMLVDPDASKKNYSDAKWIAHVKEYYPSEVKEMFPEYNGNNSETFWNDSESDPHNADDAWKYENDQSDKLTQPGKVSVIQYQYYTLEDYYMVLTNDQNMVEMDTAKFEKLRPVLNQLAISWVKMKRRVYKQVFIVGEQFFEHRKLGCTEFTMQAMTGLRDRNRREWFGLVKLMKDPQRWANKWLSQIQYILNTSSKNALLIEIGAVVNRSSLEDNLAQPGAVIDLNPGGLGKIDELSRATFPEGFDRLLSYAVTAINDVPGVNLELVGMADRDQPIGLEVQRKQAGITVLAVFFDSLRRYRKVDGKLMAYYIREYLADGRLIRIIGQAGMKYIPLIKSQMAAEYDVYVDESPTSPNSKERNFAILTQIIPIAMQAGIQIPPEILDYAPLPDDLIQKWKQMLQQPDQPDPMAEELKQIQLVLAQLEPIQKQVEIQKTASETQKNLATAQKDAAVGQEQQALAMQKFGMAQGDQQMKAANMIADQKRKDLELTLTHARKMLEIQLEDRLKQQKMNAFPTLNAIQ